MEFRKLRCEDMKDLMPYFGLRPTLCSESHPAYHLLWRHYYETAFYADEKGLLWLQRIDYDEKATMEPVCKKEHMRENFDRLQTYFTGELNQKLHMYLVDQEALDAIAPDPERYEIVEDVDSYDYIYDGDSLRELKGKK